MNRYHKKTVLVTGGTGFIGCRLAERLALEERAHVRALVNKWCNAGSLCRSNVELTQGTVTDPAALDRSVAGCDLVFHCVGIGGDEKTCTDVNVNGTRNVLQVCAKNGVERVVYLSTVGVHGPFITEGLDETAPFVKLGTPYGDSKIEAEEVFWQYVKQGKIKGTVIRPTYVWGPRSAWFTIQPVEQMVKKRFYLVDQGKGACNAVHVDNVVDLVLLAGVNDAAIGEALLVTDDSRITWREFFQHYARMTAVEPASLPSVSSKPSRGLLLLNKLTRKNHQLGESVYASIADALIGKQYKPLRAPFKIFMILSAKLAEIVNELAPYSFWDLRKYSSTGFITIDKARKILGYTPRVSLNEGMRSCELWLRDQGYL